MFLSYAREDEERAGKLANALDSAGHKVWWDNRIHGGSRFSEEIDRELSDSDAVVVLWSPASVTSGWVLDEAAEGRDSGKLIPAIIRPCRPPLGFRQYQSLDLTDAQGETAPKGLLEAIAKKTGAAMGDATKPPKAFSGFQPSVCVLPFVNMSGDPEQEYFSDGISEDITTDLSKVSALGVTARNTAFLYKSRAADVSRIASELGVSHVLEGSVRKAGTRLRISAQLIDGATGHHVWAERFDRELTDVFEIQDDISHAIVDALKLKLLPAEKRAIEKRGTENVDAYDLYLMARNSLITGNHGDPRRDEKVVRLCRRALELDPEYAKAWGLMALAQVSLRFSSGKETDTGLEAAERALSIDPTVAEAHCAKAHNLYESGDLDSATAEIQIALNLDPESWEVQREAAKLLMARKDFARAATHFEKAVAIVEADYVSWAVLATCYQAMGKRDDVLRVAQMMVSQSDKVLAEDPNNGSALGVCAGGLAILGEAERAKRQIDRAILIDPDNLNLRYNFACVLAAYLDERESALDLLKPVMTSANLTLINAAAVDPDFDSLRGDARFEDMLHAAETRLSASRR